jgi:hypothetical protein
MCPLLIIVRMYHVYLLCSYVSYKALPHHNHIVLIIRAITELITLFSFRTSKSVHILAVESPILPPDCAVAVLLRHVSQRLYVSQHGLVCRLIVSHAVKQVPYLGTGFTETQSQPLQPNPTDTSQPNSSQLVVTVSLPFDLDLSARRRSIFHITTHEKPLIDSAVYRSGSRSTPLA